MAASGAKVLQLRSVEYARTHGVRIHCRSSFEDGPGTVVVGEDETMEHPLITAVTHSTEEARITLLGVPDRPGAAAVDLPRAGRRRLQPRHDHPERAAREGRDAEVSFTVSAEDLRAAERALEPIDRRARGRPRRHRPRDRQGLDRRRRHALASRASPPRCSRRSRARAINIEMISTSPIKISCVIRADLVPAGGAGAARRVRARRDDGRAESPIGQEAAMTGACDRVAVVGATGAVGTTMLELLRRARRSRRDEIVPFASRALGRASWSRRPDRAGADRRRPRGLRHRAVLGRRLGLARVGARGSSARAPS